MLVLAGITERVDLGIALYLARGLGHDRNVACAGVRTVPLRDGADQVAAVLPGLVDQELFICAAGVFGDAFRLHGEPGRVHLGQHDQPGPGDRRLSDQRRDVLAGSFGVLPHDVVLDGCDLHLSTSFSRVRASASTVGCLQNAKRTKVSPASES